MKRFWILMAVLVLSCFPAFAEEIDISGMDLETKLALHARLDESIAEDLHCLLDADTIYQGVYVVGKDIAPGYYLFTCTVDTEDDGNFDFWYDVYATEEDYQSHNRKYFERFNVGESSSITLEEGMVIDIIRGIAQLQQATKPNWAP